MKPTIRMGLVGLAVVALSLSAVPAAQAETYDVTATPTTGIDTGTKITITIAGLSGSVGVHLNICKLPDDPSNPMLCDPLTWRQVTADGAGGTTTSPVTISANATFYVLKQIDCKVDKCGIYVRGDYNNVTNPALQKIIPLTFKSAAVLAADWPTVRQGDTELGEIRGDLVVQVPSTLSIITKSGLPVTLNALDSNCRVSGAQVTALKDAGVCDISVTHLGNKDYRPMTEYFSFNLRPYPTLKTGFPKVRGATVGQSVRFAKSAFSSSNGQTVHLRSLRPEKCTLTSSGSKYRLRFKDAGTCRLQAYVEVAAGSGQTLRESVRYIVRDR